MNGGSSSDAPNVVRLAAARQIERTPPHNEEAERAVLGSLLIQNEAMSECLVRMGASAKDKWGSEYFHDERHQVLFETMAEMHDRHQALDPVTLKQRLTDKGALEKVGGETYLYELLNCVPTASNILYYLDIVRDCFLRRLLIEVGSKIVAESFEMPHESADQLAEAADQMMFNVTKRQFTHEAVHVKDLVGDVMQAIEDAHDKKGALQGLPSGFRDLDRLTGGFRPGEMIVIAARPGKGKTAFAMNIAEKVGIEERLPVAVFSLEMTREQLLMRMVSSMAKVDSSKMRDGFTTDRDHGAIIEAMSRLTKSQIFIDDTGALNIVHLRAKARRLKRQHDVKMFVVDYLQLLHGSAVRKMENRAQEVAEISGGIKALAKELKVPFLVLSQLNREVEKREGGKPRLADLRESGAIEQDADVVLLLARGSHEEEEDTEGEAEVVIGKQRNGPTGSVKLTFLSQYTKFVERAKTDEEYASDPV